MRAPKTMTATVLLDAPSIAMPFPEQLQQLLLIGTAQREP